MHNRETYALPYKHETGNQTDCASSACAADTCMGSGSSATARSENVCSGSAIACTFAPMPGVYDCNRRNNATADTSADNQAAQDCLSMLLIPLSDKQSSAAPVPPLTPDPTTPANSMSQPLVPCPQNTHHLITAFHSRLLLTYIKPQCARKAI